MCLSANQLNPANFFAQLKGAVTKERCKAATGLVDHFDLKIVLYMVQFFWFILKNRVKKRLGTTYTKVELIGLRNMWLIFLEIRFI